MAEGSGPARPLLAGCWLLQGHMHADRLRQRAAAPICGCAHHPWLPPLPDLPRSQVSDPLWLKFTGLLGVAHAALVRGAVAQQQLLIVSPDPWRGVQAMQAHRSQWVW